MMFRRLGAGLALLVVWLGFAVPAHALSIEIFYLTVNPVETTPAQLTTMDVTATGSAPGEFLSVTFQNVRIASGYTGTGGGASTDLVRNGVSVPSGLATCGMNTANLIYNGVVRANTTVYVYCPSVSVTPSPVTWDNGKISFTVTGIGFPAYRNISLTLDDVSVPGLNDVVSDGNGSFVESATVVGPRCGRHAIFATAWPGQAPQYVISSYEIRPAARVAVDPYPSLPTYRGFAVMGCVTPSPSDGGGDPTPTPSPSPATPGQPKLTANPAVFVSGSYTHVTGTGFVAGQPITLSWKSPAGATLLPCSPNADPPPPLVADASGNLTTVCFATPHLILGAAQLVATQAGGVGASPSLSAAAPVVIEGGTMQPSSSDQFIFRR